MRIVMMTNTYLPHIGGVAASVASFTDELRRRGHQVLVVAPEFEGMPKDEVDVIRIRALQKFNGSDFSVIISTPPRLSARLENFRPQIIHSHHPFLLGSTALRGAAKFHLPLVFTHHTMYEQYTHYVPGNFPRMKQFVINLSTGYANLCNQVIAPSRSIADILRRRGVNAPIDVIPTGIEVQRFMEGDGDRWRQRFQIPAEAQVIGHVGRLAPEKNLSFLARWTARAIAEHQRECHFLAVGRGPSAQTIEEEFSAAGVHERLHMPGKLVGQDLIDAYHTMNLFAFASKSETQGMVLAEAMAAGLPVIALSAPGADEVVKNGKNGFLLDREQGETFKEAILKALSLPPAHLKLMSNAARATAEQFSTANSTDQLIALYRQLSYQPGGAAGAGQDKFWRKTVDAIKAEWELISNYTEATTTALKKKQD